MDLATLFERYGALALENQHRLAAVVGKRPWRFDLERSRLTFEPDIELGVQPAGTVSHRTMTWQWAWASPQSEIPDAALEAAREVARFGREHAVEELQAARVEIDEENDAHRLVMVAAGIAGAGAYYRAPYEGGALYLLVDDSDVLRAATARDAGSIIARFGEFISIFDVAHRPALRAYLEARDFEIEDAPPSLFARSSEGDTIIATFDARGRLQELELAR